MHLVIKEIDRILRHDRYMALYVSDSYKKNKPFIPIGFRLFAMLNELFTPIDIIAVTRHNLKMDRNNWHKAAIERNYFLRGFNYLFIMYKPSVKKKEYEIPDRRDIMEKEKQINDFLRGPRTVQYQD
jgi:hypothetical protein